MSLQHEGKMFGLELTTIPGLLHTNPSESFHCAIQEQNVLCIQGVITCRVGAACSLGGTWGKGVLSARRRRSRASSRPRRPPEAPQRSCRRRSQLHAATASTGNTATTLTNSVVSSIMLQILPTCLLRIVRKTETYKDFNYLNGK